jgi:hypothetical protein
VNITATGYSMIRVVCRVLLLLVLVAGAKIAFAPAGLNLAHYTPNQLFRDMGLPYEFILGYEVHFHLFLHFIVACSVTLLIYGAKVFARCSFGRQIIYSVSVTMAFSLATEIIQSSIGRNVEVIDLLMAGLGMLTAVFILLKIAVFR